MRYLLTFLLLWLSILPNLAMGAAKYDVLIVSDSAQKGQTDMAKRARKDLEKMRADIGLSSSDLPVDEYDVHVAGQQVAVKRLQLGNAPLMAVCALGGADRKPVKVLQQFPMDGRTLAHSCLYAMAYASRKVGVKLPFLGIAATDLTAMVQEQLHVPAGPGVAVIGVSPNSPAAAAGVQPKDILLEIDGSQVTNKEVMASLVHLRKVGDILKLKIRRGQETLTLTATLTEAPQNPPPPAKGP